MQLPFMPMPFVKICQMAAIGRPIEVSHQCFSSILVNLVYFKARFAQKKPRSKGGLHMSPAARGLVKQIFNRAFSVALNDL